VTEANLNSFSTSALEEGEWLTSHLSHFRPRETTACPHVRAPRNPVNSRLSRPHSWSGQLGEEKISCPSGMQAHFFSHTACV